MFICQDFDGDMIAITAGDTWVNKIVWGCLRKQGLQASVRVNTTILKI
jgi:hypothetical protein